MTRLTQQEVEAALAEGLPGWGSGDGALVREYRFDDFRAAIAFVGRVADEAERAGHHPDILIRYRRVTVTLSTHDEGGITAQDVALARTLDRIAGEAA